MDSIRGGRGLVVAELSLRPQKAARFELLLVYVCCWTTNCEPLRRKTFSQWISRQTDAEDADTFALHAYIAGENAATSTRATGLFHSRYLLRNYKGNPNIANQS